LWRVPCPRERRFDDRERFDGLNTQFSVDQRHVRADGQHDLPLGVVVALQEALAGTTGEAEDIGGLVECAPVLLAGILELRVEPRLFVEQFEPLAFVFRVRQQGAISVTGGRLQADEIVEAFLTIGACPLA